MHTKTYAIGSLMHFFFNPDVPSQMCREHEFAAVEQPVEAFTNILFSSGTTGNIKFI